MDVRLYLPVTVIGPALAGSKSFWMRVSILVKSALSNSCENVRHR